MTDNPSIPDGFIHPGSLLIAGASPKKTSVANALLQNILQHGYTGEVYPVNPKYDTVLDRPCYRSVGDLPTTPDLAVIAVPTAAVAPVLQECGEKGIQAAIVITAGFGETGKDGKAREQRITSICREYGITLLGPNCLGYINTDPSVSLNATFGRSMPNPGGVSFFSQSGAVGIHALEYEKENDLGIAKFFSLGNKAILTEKEVLSYLGNDPNTKVILGYIEHFSNPREFFKVARSIASGKNPKPIVLLKGGRTESGQRATSSHTGALAERDEVLDLLFHQSGIIRVDTLEELFQTGLLFSEQPPIQGNRITVVTNAGGPAILVTDHAEGHGLNLPEPSKELKEQLQTFLPSTAGLNNPIDLIGDADEKRFRNTLLAIIEHGGTDGLLVMGTPQMMTPMQEITREVADLAPKARDKGITLACSLLDVDEREAIRVSLDQANVPYFDFGEDAVRALAKGASLHKWREEPETDHQEAPNTNGKTEELLFKARERGEHFLSEPDSYRVLKEHGIPVSPFMEMSPEAFDPEGIRELRFPLVMKVVSPDIIHKIEYKGVITRLKTEEEAKAAFQEMTTRLEREHPEVRIKSIMFQEMVRNGIETIIGGSWDAHFGNLIMFGSGGSFVEVFRDVSFRMAPVGPTSARKMIEEVKGKKLLKGFRGKPHMDLNALQDVIIRASHLIAAHDAISEIDLNPVFALEKGAMVADSRIILKEEDTTTDNP